MIFPKTEIGTQLQFTDKGFVDKKLVVDTLAEAIANSFDGYHCYCKETGQFLNFFTSPSGGNTFNAENPLPFSTGEELGRRILPVPTIDMLKDGYGNSSLTLGAAMARATVFLYETASLYRYYPNDGAGLTEDFYNIIRAGNLNPDQNGVWIRENTRINTSAMMGVLKKTPDNSPLQTVFMQLGDSVICTEAMSFNAERPKLESITITTTGPGVVMRIATDGTPDDFQYYAIGGDNTAMQQQIDQILAVIAEPPTYTAPTATITSATQTVEKGTNLNLTLNIGFNKNDAGNATGFNLLRNGVSISNAQNNTVPENNVQAVTTFQGQVSYGEGPIKNNNLGIADPTGHIMPGTVNTPVQTITPRLKMFYGSVAAIPTDSAQVRALASAFENVAQIDLQTGTVNKIFVVAIPATKSITNVTDVTNLGANITASYQLIDGAFIVNDAGGNAQTYKLYAMTNAVPYSTTATHRITTV